MTRSPAEDPYKKFVVTCRTPTISRADFHARKIPCIRHAQLSASRIGNRSLRDDLLCIDIRHSCLSSLRAEEDWGQDYELFLRICVVIDTMARELLLR